MTHTAGQGSHDHLVNSDKQAIDVASPPWHFTPAGPSRPILTPRWRAGPNPEVASSNLTRGATLPPKSSYFLCPP